MITFLLQLLSWVALLVFLLALVLLFIWMFSIIKAKVPFVSVPSKVLEDIEKALNLKDDSVVYDLGCGDGKVLFYLAKKYSKAKYIGIENSLFPLILAHVRNWWYKKVNKINNIEIIRGDFFDTDLSKATHIFTYLFPKVMDDLLPKLYTELKPGACLVSASFQFTGKKEKEVIDLKRGKYQLAKKIYIYEF